MQYIEQGPDIPDELIQAHEDGRVVFFCGAGISYPAGLPGFSGLVEKIYKELRIGPDDLEKVALKDRKFDRALNLLETRITEGKKNVRESLMEVLGSKPNKKMDQSTHSALLKLARNRNDKTRLVTTNFDRIFEETISYENLEVHSDAAPMLPIPKETKWDSIVYLHGLLPENNDRARLDQLVLTSGDFGSAYLTERWASRFISEVFNNYVVCFIGYSINDPVLQYLLDALAADRMQGENLPNAYAFGGFNEGKEYEAGKEWVAKGVIPILYKIARGRYPHIKLHKTLKSWAETYADGITGKESIIAKYAGSKPEEYEDNRNLLWAISDESGKPAKYFANFKPAPDLDWLMKVFSQSYSSTSINGCEGEHERMPLYSAKYQDVLDLMNRNKNVGIYSKLINVIMHLDYWVAKNHLDKPELAIWLAQETGQLRKGLLWAIERYLPDLILKKGEYAKTDEPLNLLMAKIWILLLSGRIEPSNTHTGNTIFSMYHWKKVFFKIGLTEELRFSLREYLKPQILTKEPLKYGIKEKTKKITRLNQIIDWEVVLASDSSDIADIDNDKWRDVLPLLLSDFQQLLQDALDLFYDLGRENNSELFDVSHIHLPSISPHQQNRKHNKWVTLIELLRDAWVETKNKNRKKAQEIAHQWFDMPYFTFKRLALYAASHENCIKNEDWVSWLLKNNGKILYSSYMRREVLRLLVLRGGELSQRHKEKIEDAILSWPDGRERFILLYLAKLDNRKNKLSPNAAKKLKELSANNPGWELDDEYQFDEFSNLMLMSGEPGTDKYFPREEVPEKFEDAKKWLKEKVKTGKVSEDRAWSNFCRQEARISHRLLEETIHEIGYDSMAESLSSAIWAWSILDDKSEMWELAERLIEKLPDSAFASVATPIASFIRNYATAISKDQDKSFLNICDRILRVEHEKLSPINSLSELRNHSVADTTEAILYLYSSRRKENDKILPDDINRLFTRISDTKVGAYRSGRFMLASRLIFLYTVDEEWTKKHLLPLFDWSINEDEATSAWKGFLWVARIHTPILIELKDAIFSTIKFYDRLGDCAFQIARIFTYMALEHRESCTVDEYRESFESFHDEGLRQCIIAAKDAIMGAGEKKSNYYKNRFLPFLKTIWPKNKGKLSGGISEQFIFLCISLEYEFLDALDAVFDYLVPIEYCNNIIRKIVNSNLINSNSCEKIIDLLDIIVIEEKLWGTRELEKCLDKIVEECPTIEKNRKYQKLRSYIR